MKQKRNNKAFGDKEKDRITIPLQLQYAEPEARTMKSKVSDEGTTKMLPRGITPGSSPEVPALIKQLLPSAGAYLRAKHVLGPPQLILTTLSTGV